MVCRCTDHMKQCTVRRKRVRPVIGKDGSDHRMGADMLVGGCGSLALHAYACMPQTACCAHAAYFNGGLSTHVDAEEHAELFAYVQQPAGHMQYN